MKPCASASQFLFLIGRSFHGLMENFGTDNNAVCTSESLSPPEGQPAQKSYKDFNTNWPLDSWSVTEPSDGYQVAYIRLLSKFVH